MTNSFQVPLPHEAYPPDLDRPSSAVLHDSRPPSPRTHTYADADAEAEADDREALELHQIQTHEDADLNESSPSVSSGEEIRITTRRTRSRASVQSTRAHRGKDPWSRLCRFWTHHVTLTVPQKSNRDHFALERTFLAYIRTSVVIAMQGVLIAQLFRLQRSNQDQDRLRFYQVGIPLSVTCHCVAVVVALIGAYRFWRQQSAIARGKVHAGGWELNSVGILLFLIILVTLVISVVIIVEIEKSPTNLLKRLLLF
ncbi:hypothetical protein N7509_008358 [Penicillium cosmopolitanum]|uniref:DUF202 domain-containing protein n=1 Tax=Penicillium cosmopolitanum TaxID=1131564 RepID=A0A9W9VMG2_9EURO|nr:uncharacterized protein N7509_008358 [Penicillium cosmopolitanum]KAJ5385817.1 hypothetical protein N7509_008358 [Penicillium cosmopolitanum]